MDIAYQTDPIDLDRYLPAKNNEQINAFLSNDDGLLELRKKAFFRRLYGNCDFSDTTHLVSTFSKCTFDQGYLIFHRLPHERYFFYARNVPAYSIKN